MVSFGTAISLFYKNYVNFEGRASRAEYWWPTLLHGTIYTGLIIAFLMMVGTSDVDASGGSDDIEASIWVILGVGFVFWVLNVLPFLSLKVRRFHDLEQTGWLIPVFFIANIFVPFVELARLIWFAFPGTEGPNQYGADPYTDNAEVFG